MKVESASLYVIELPLKFRFETSFGVQTHRRLFLLALRGEGVTGWGEGVMTPFPLFREETLAGALDFLENALLPRVVGRDLENPAALAAVFAPFRGQRMAKAAVEMAFWDLYSRALGRPLKDLLGGVRERIPVGISLGIQPSIEATVEAVGQKIAEGYKRIKLKIKPGWDVAVVEAVRQAYPEAPLSVDANAAYRLSDYRVFQALDAFDLAYIEQPLHFEDLADHAKLQARIKTPICLDESVVSKETARAALEADATRVINVKVARVGGHAEARRIAELAEAFGAPVWMGGMLETGVGRAHAIHAATLPNYHLPGDTSSSTRYWEEDVITAPLIAKDGWMPVPEGPGIGVEVDEAGLKRRALKTITI